MRVLKMACCLLAMTASGKTPLQKPPVKEMGRTNPYETQPAAEQAGHKLFLRECSSCHGTRAEGTERVPALASPTVQQAPAGAIFWVLRNGSLRHGMPSFAHLPEQQRWQIVTYLKSLQ